MVKCKNLLEIFEGINHLFPGITSDILHGILDPRTVNHPKEIEHIINHNISILRRKLDNFTKSNPNLRNEVNSFMSNRGNFSQEEWAQMKNFELNLSKFREDLCMKIQKESVSDYKKEKQLPLKTKKEKTKKQIRSRSNWLQA